MIYLISHVYFRKYFLQEDRCANDEQNLGQFVRMQEEVDILQGALRDIAHALIQDAETKDPEILSATHVHLSASTPVPQK